MYVVTQEVSCSLSGPHLTNSEVLDNRFLYSREGMQAPKRHLLGISRLLLRFFNRRLFEQDTSKLFLRR